MATVPFVTGSQQLSSFESRHLAKSDVRHSQKDWLTQSCQKVTAKNIFSWTANSQPFLQASISSTVEVCNTGHIIMLKVILKLSQGICNARELADSSTKKLLLTSFRRKRERNTTAMESKQFTTRKSDLGL